ncbi:MAG: DUF1326 domain-containing protein [Candidatus Kuenenia sp.]|nr:DUF1326 domain-containing protein [Candidatus Kuenenia hertensis]
MICRGKYVLSGFVIAMVFLFCLATDSFAGPSWNIEGEYFEGCTCDPGCPCLFGSEPTYKKCKIAGVFHIKKGRYGEYPLAGQTVIGMTDFTADPNNNWVVFYLSDKVSGIQKNALLEIFKNRVFNFAEVPSNRIIVKSLPIQIESSAWYKKAMAGDNLVLEVEILRGKGDPTKPLQIINKKFAIWASEFDTTLNMGKAIKHRFHEGDYEWNYDGRSGFATTFKFTSSD